MIPGEYVKVRFNRESCPNSSQITVLNETIGKDLRSGQTRCHL